MEGNRVVDMDTVEFLSMCPQLHTLTLSSNAVCSTSFFRQHVAESIPQLKVLDDVDLSVADRSPMKEGGSKVDLHGFDEDTNRDELDEDRRLLFDLQVQPNFRHFNVGDACPALKKLVYLFPSLLYKCPSDIKTVRKKEQIDVIGENAPHRR
jgi:hypothetical protein